MKKSDAVAFLWNEAYSPLVTSIADNEGKLDDYYIKTALNVENKVETLNYLFERLVIKDSKAYKVKNQPPNLTNNLSMLY